MKKVFLSMILALLGFTLLGCGTISGIGKDMESLGDVFIKGSDHYKEAVKENPPGSKMQ